jgi:uncharacterized hydrophobic protein (TIGR00271 family)
MAEEIAVVEAKIRGDAKMDRAFLALLIAAAVISTFGLEQNNTVTLIGAMVIAPLMPSIRALGYGLIRLDARTIGTALLTVLVSGVVVVVLGGFFGYLAQRPAFGSEILSRTSISFLGLGVAVVSGLLAGLSRVGWEKRMTDALIGVGIAISLVPPLCVVGIALVYGSYYEAWGALSIFLVNAIGISLACALSFWATGYGPKQSWKALAGLAIFAIVLAPLVPELARQGARVRELSRVEEFLHARIQTYLPSALEVESVAISWKDRPHAVVAVIRLQRLPTRDEVRALNAALNIDAAEPLRVSVVQDGAIVVTP